MGLREYLKSIQNKRVAVIGIGVSNRPLLDLLLSAGISVTACDRRPRSAFGSLAEDLERRGCRLVLGEDYLDHLDEDLVFRTPGLHPRFLEKAKARGCEITSEMEVFFRLCPCPIIAVTGSDGKTTTTTIIARLLEAAGKTVHVGGNIGHPLLAETDAILPEDWVVVELSSFQLMDMTRSAHIAVLTNVAPNHLDVHTDMAEYVAAKEKVFLYQGPGDKLVCNFDNEIARTVSEKAAGKVEYFTRKTEGEPGAFLRDGVIWMGNGQGERPVLPVDGIRLPGTHNVENYMAAVAAVDGLVPDQVIRSFAAAFGGVEHRIEFVRELRGVRYYNDAIASSPSRTRACLLAFPERVILLAGGKDKGVPYTELGGVINDHVKRLILCGATAGPIRAAVEGADNYAGLPVTEVKDWRSAVRAAAAAAVPGDVVVMSPASTSFDMFQNFMEKGKVYKALVEELE